MIHPGTLDFLHELKENNHKDWFDTHRKDYQLARTNFLDVTQQLIDGISTFDDGVAASHLDPKKCIMRINRDIRFSKDKSPYKTNFFCFINREGKKSPFAGYYLSIGADEAFQGGGIYMPEASALANIRQEIDYNLEEWEKIASEKSLANLYGEIKPSGELTRPPKGYDKENPALKWLKYKGYYTQKMLSKKEMTSQQFVADTIAGYQSLRELVAFINRSIE